MKKALICLLCLLLLAFSGCGRQEVPPTADLSQPVAETLSGRVAELFTEGASPDKAEVLTLDMGEQGLRHLTLEKSTQYALWYADSGMSAEIRPEDVQPGDWVEIDSMRDQLSDRHTAVRVTVMRENDPAGTPDIFWKEPPGLQIVSWEQETAALRGGFEWNYDAGDGTMAGVIADSMHPLQAREYMTPLRVTPSTFSSVDPHAVWLRFELVPDAVTVRYWDESARNAKAGNYPPGQELAVEFRPVDLEAGRFEAEYVIELRPENCVYEVTAQWTRFTRFGGEASYSFCTEMPGLTMQDGGELTQMPARHVGNP